MSVRNRGVQARLVDELTIKLVVVDRQSALFAMPDLTSESVFPTNLVVEHPGFVAMQVRAFEAVWDGAESLSRRSESDQRIGHGTRP